MRNSIAASRAVAARLIGWQAAAAVLTAALFLLAGTRAAVAALYGGAVVVVPTAWFVLRMLAQPEGAPAHKVLGVLHRAEAVKWFMMVFGLWLGTRWFGGTYLPVLVAGFACFVANGLVLLTTRHL